MVSPIGDGRLTFGYQRLEKDAEMIFFHFFCCNVLSSAVDIFE